MTRKYQTEHNSHDSELNLYLGRLRENHPVLPPTVAPQCTFTANFVIVSRYSTINTMASAVIQKKTVLITGCSTGSIGWAVTRVFLEQNFHVFAGVRSRSKAQDLAELRKVDILELDVTVPQTITLYR
ncbi:hypothetical protein N0V93_009330 [Gnomoniopsis smithogilvyi]|uniref:Uncharacterized protein n=1 Tax=Gnomoniopsis smithogilvyi TaxID=1191159 RepID=A0A9W8YJF5_9PEZI|nr:hypothetical protein N0V93_009330 [Gnomoniopsis smithogilvyi]